jgi:hypothetical protein
VETRGDPRAQAQIYEVRCFRCNVSFPPDAKTCLHCGARLGLSSEVGALPRVAIPDEAGEQQVPTVARVLLWAVSAGVAILLSALQTCR